MKITVLGGGHGCNTAVVEMAEKGHQTRLWRRDSTELKELLTIDSLSLTSIVSVAAGRDLYAEGRTLENLGLGKLSRTQMSELLTKGYNS
jgi:hypothetical protein